MPGFISRSRVSVSVLGAVALIVSVFAPFMAGIQPAAAAPQPGVANVAIAFTANPITANGTATTTATATVTDATSALPLQNETVTWSSTDTTTPATHDVTFSPTTCTTNASGKCSVVITASTTADTETIKASATGVDNGSGTAQLTEIAGPTSVVTLVLNPTAIPADGHSRTSATATVKDVNNNPIIASVVDFGTDGDVTFVGGTTQCTTGNDGSCSVTIQASTTVDVEHISAANGGHSASATLTEFTPAGSVAVTLSPASIPADGSSTTTATATVKDGSNNVESGALVVFSTNGDAGFPSGATCTTGADGTCGVTVRASSTADSETIKALVGNNPGVAGTATLTEFKAPAAITLTLTPSSLPADGTSESVASVTVKDAATTPAAVTDALVTFTRSGDVTFKNGVSSCRTDNTGACSVTIVASSTADAETITAHVGSATAAQTLTEYAVPNSVSVSLSKTNIPADGVTTSVATATVTGAGGPVANAPVTFSKTGNVTFQGNSNTCTTNAQGTCSVTLVAPTNAEIDTITATADGKSGNATLTVYALPNSITLSLNPASVPADSTSISTATVTVQDGTSSGDPGAVVTLTRSGDVTFPNGATCTTGADGTCTVQIKASSTADTETITASTANNKSVQASLKEYVTPAAVAVSLSPSSVAANGTDQSTATITVTAAGGAGDVGVPVTVTSPGGDVTFSDGNGGFTSTGSCTTGSGGTCPVTIKASATPDQEHITATTANGKTGSATLTEYGAPANISITLNPTAVRANGTDQSVATMTVTDGNGAAVNGAAVQLSTDGDVGFSSGGACTTGAVGTCTVTITASTTADQETITAATGTNGAVKNSALLTEFGTPATTTLSLNPAAVAVNGTSVATATVKDANGLGVAGANASFSVSGTGAYFPGASFCSTGSDGTCSVTIKAASSPGSDTVSVVAGGHTDSKKLTEYGAPAAISLSFTGGKSTLVANGTDTTTAVAAVTDSAGNAVPSAPISFATTGDMTFSNSGGCTTAADGTCSVTVTSSVTADQETITASTANSKTSSKTVTETPGPVATVALQLSPSSIVANGTSTSTATATVKDAHDNLISSAPVTFTTSGDVTFSNSAACTTDATGTCTVTVTSSVTADTETITAHDGAVTGTASLTETAGPAATITVALSKATVVANGTDTSTATATVKDAHNNVVASAPVTFTTNGDVTFSNGGACTTAAGGTCAVTVTASTTPDAETITAHQGGLTGTATLTETPNTSVHVVLDPTSIPADGNSGSLAEATVTDGAGHAVNGATVTWATSGDVDFSDGGQCVTGSEGVNGVCDVIIFSSTTADTETITATVGAIHGTAALTETAPRSGYWLVGGKGDVYSFGDAKWMGNAPVGSNTAVDIEGTVTGNGYWVLDNAGHVYRFGDAIWYGDMDLDSGERAVSMSADPYGDGYWVFTNFGRVQEFGNSGFFGDMDGKPLNAPIVGSVATPDGEGYWMVAADGGIFSFGTARFYGSMGGRPLNKPVVGLVPNPDPNSVGGYWLDAADGGTFSFGDAPFRGSVPGVVNGPLNKPVIGMVAYGNGYLMVASDGGVFDFSDKPFSGSLGSNPPPVPIANIAAIAP